MRFVICIVAIVGLCSCGNIPVPNPTGYLQERDGGATGKRLFGDEEVSLSPRQWSRYKIGTICHTPEATGEIIKFIETTCQKTQRCVEGWQDIILQYEKKMRIRRR